MEILEFGSASFSVDDQRRTMRGVVIPWGKIGRHRNGKQWRFSRGSLKYGHEKFVRFNNDHDQSQILGRPIAVEDTDEGLVMTFKVKDGPAGDRALAMARDGFKTGLSVEVEIDSMDTEKDSENAGTLLVNMAHLTGVAFVKEPAFDDSRLNLVQMGRNGGTMPCASCEQVHADGVTACTPIIPPVQTPAPVMFSADQVAAMFAQAGIQAPTPAPVVEPRPVLVPTTPAVVTEPQSYAFDRDGHLQAARHDFAVDMVRGMNPAFADLGARQRVEEFIAAQFATVTTDVDELNPTINQNRYITQRQYRSPVWDRINKGALPNGVQPFSWAFENSASGLVGPHTEGVEPTPGSYTTNKQIVLPTATSGKAKISREVWDMGGQPGTADLIWRKMVQGYQEALEAKAIATLDAVTPTSVTLTTGGGTTGQTLASELVAAFTKLQYVRGGFSMDSLFAQVDLMLAITGAKATDGSFLFPALGATNRDGTVRSRFAGVDINGITALPSWALAATGIVPASSYLFDSGSVDGWATPPRQLLMPEIEVANVYIGIWGYSAAAINDLAGVRELIYDPA